MTQLKAFLDLFLHLDKHLASVIQDYGTWTYAILFLIIFCETGLVVTPILPGDSLLFAAGAIAATKVLDVHLLALLLFIAAVLGDTVNYHIGRFIGPKVFERKNSKIFKKEYLDRTQHFYERYGAKAIVLARFVPIVRTFAPFLAGVGKMNYGIFLTYNSVGAAFWIGLLTYSGYFFGNIPFVERNFGLVVVAIIIISILPAIFEYVRASRSVSTGGQSS